MPSKNYPQADVDETVHLILMEEPDIEMKAAWEQVKELHPRIRLSQFGLEWAAYRGMDGVPPSKVI